VRLRQFWKIKKQTPPESGVCFCLRCKKENYFFFLATFFLATFLAAFLAFFFAAIIVIFFIFLKSFVTTFDLFIIYSMAENYKKIFSCYY